MIKHIHESNLIEGYDDPEFDKQSMVAWKFLKGQKKLTRAVVCEVQRLIVESQSDLSKTERGNYRYVQVWVGNHQPPNALRVPELMESWLFTYEGSTPKEAHVEFETIHPFIDGNGRTGRMLMWWHELKRGEKPTLILNSKKQDYYRWFTGASQNQPRKDGQDEAR